MARFKKILSVFVASALCAATCLGSVFTGVFAAGSTTYTIKQLFDGGNLKLLGRTKFVGNNLLTEWAGTGFEINVNVTDPAGTDFTLNTHYEISSIHYALSKKGSYTPVRVHEDIIIDDEIDEDYSFRMAAFDSKLKSFKYADVFDDSGKIKPGVLETEFSVTRHIPYGQHTLRVMRDSGPDKYHNYTHQFVSIETAAQILEKPADKEFYIEYIGDSYGNASGTLNPLTPGKGGGSDAENSSIVNSYGYVSAQQLGADFSIVAMGGYGVLKNSGASVEAVDTGTSMLDLFPYVDAENDYTREKASEATYDHDFARKADCVVIALGSNDGQGKMDEWKSEANRLLDMVIEEYGADVPIVWMGTSTLNLQFMYLNNLKNTNTKYKNLHPFRCYVGGNGGVALSTQTTGHMSDLSERQMGGYLANYMLAEGVIVPESGEEPVIPDNIVEYYVDGQSGGDGSLASPFTYVADAEKALKAKVATISGDDESISARIYIMNKQEWVPCAAAANGNSMTGYTELIKSSNGNEITVEIIGYNPTGSKPGITVANGGSASNAWRRLCNNYRFENIKITGQGDNELGGFATLYANCFNVTFDTGTEIYNATQTAKCSNAYFSTLNGTHATSSSSTSTAAVADDAVKSNIVINSGTFISVNTAGISANGAYGPSGSIANWKYDVFTTPHYYSTTVNGGYVENLAAGSGSLVTGDNTYVSITVNGGHIKTLYGSYAPNVSNVYNKVQHGNFDVTVNGGNIDVYNGLTGGAENNLAYYYGDYTFNMNAGTIGKSGTTTFKSVSSYVYAENVTNNISEGHIYVEPKSMTAGSSQGVYFGGYYGTEVKNLTNNISGGEIMCRFGKAQASVFMGGEYNFKIGEANNNIDGGRFMFYPLDESMTVSSSTVSTSSGVYFGGIKGSIETLNNTVTGGLFDCVSSTGLFQTNFASRDAGSWVGKLTNVIGIEGTDVAPAFQGCMEYFGSTSTSFGQKAKGLTTQLDPTKLENMSDEVVISNTIHSLTVTGSVVLGPATVPSASAVVQTAGSVENVINHGLFQSTLYCGGSAIYGHLKTTINGGHFCNVYGSGANYAGSKVYNGTELIINGADPTNTNPFIKQGFKSYAAIAGKTYNVFAGGNNCNIPKPLTEGRDTIKLTVNGGVFPTTKSTSTTGCSLFGGSLCGTINGNINTTINGGTFYHFYGAGSYSGSTYSDVIGDITNTVNGGTFYWDYHGGAYMGNVHGSITNTMNNIDERNNWYGNSNGGGLLEGTLTNNFNGGTYTYTLYCTNGSNSNMTGLGGGIGAVVNNVHGGTFSAPFVAGKSTTGTLKATVTTNIVEKQKTPVITANTFKSNIYAGSKGSSEGDVVLNINTGTAATLPTILLAPDSGYTLTGNVTVNGGTAHFTDVKAINGTVTGNKNVNFDLSKGTIIINKAIGTSALGDYNLNIKGGSYEILVAGGTAEVDNADTSSGKITFRTYDNPVTSGKVYIKLPANTPVDKIECTKKDGVVGAITAFKDTDAVKVVGVSKVNENYAANFLLDDALTANILIENAAPVTELMNTFGKVSYQYSFDGNTVSGFITTSTPTKTEGGKTYYVISFPVSTGKFGEEVGLSVAGYVNKSITINDILAAGKAQYAGQSEFEALFDTLSLYGAEAAACFYEGTDPKENYDGIDELTAKYNAGFNRAKQTYLTDTNLLLKDRVVAKFYINESNISDITKITLNGEEIDLDIKAYTGTLGYKYVLSVPIKAKDMYKSFTVKLYEGDTAVDEITTSIGYYCKTYIESQEEIAKPYKNLSKALLMYIDQVKTCYDK